MAEVTISINGRNFDIGCDNGQEGRIVDLAYYIDEKVQQISRSGGAFNDAHLLVLGALVLADELFEARETPAAGRVARAPAAPAATPAPVVNREEEQILVRALDQLAKRIEGIAARVQAA